MSHGACMSGGATLARSIKAAEEAIGAALVGRRPGDMMS